MDHNELPQGLKRFLLAFILDSFKSFNLRVQIDKCCCRLLYDNDVYVEYINLLTYNNVYSQVQYTSGASYYLYN